VLGFRQGHLVFDGPPEDLSERALEAIFSTLSVGSGGPASVALPAPEPITA
jgi:ABC-type phosphate/phosphonate transport system ATPase subunit